jgi:aspartyl/asparaginyl-tRNA synthetase
MEAPAVIDVGLADTISRQASATRRFLESERFYELFVPHLTRNQNLPFRSTFQVSAPELDFTGALRVGAALFLAETISELKRAYTLSTSFRADPIPGHKLVEFQLLEAWGEGGGDDARQLVEGLLRRQIGALLDSPTSLPLERARQLEAIEFPLQSVTYEEARRRAGLEAGQRPGNETVEVFGSKPIFITDIPENLDRSLVDVRQHGNRLHSGFLLMAPFAGNVAVGGELETDYDTLSAQFDRSAFLEELLRFGGEKRQVERYLRSISRLETPHFKLAIGFERMTQYLLGVDRIEDAVLLPVRGQVIDDTGGEQVPERVRRPGQDQLAEGNGVQGMPLPPAPESSS